MLCNTIYLFHCIDKKIRRFALISLACFARSPVCGCQSRVWKYRSTIKLKIIGEVKLSNARQRSTIRTGQENAPLLFIFNMLSFDKQPRTSTQKRPTKIHEIEIPNHYILKHLYSHKFLSVVFCFFKLLTSILQTIPKILPKLFSNLHWPISYRF